MKRLADEIVKGKNLQENLSVFAHQMMGIYNDYSYVRLSLNYFTYFEIINEDFEKDANLKKLVEDFNDIILKGVIRDASGEELEELLIKLEKIRSYVINVMKGLTSYVDIFNIYEYCMNRVEYRFKDGSEYTKESDEDITRKIISYILNDNDNVVINTKISETVRQLPLRMTKGKFFELLKAGLLVYKGSNISDTKDFVYMLKTSAMLEVSEHISLLNDDIKAIYDEFSRVEFADIDEKTFKDLDAKRAYAVDYIMQSINIYMTLGEIINDTYVILLTKPYILTDTKDAVNCKAIVSKVNNLFDVSDYEEEYDRIVEGFVDLEGRQEILQNRFSSYEYVVEQVLSEKADLLNSLNISHLYNALDRIKALESGSIFVEFNEKEEGIADEKYIDEITNAMISELTDFFNGHERMLNRAVMAHILSGLPVFFGNAMEIQDYIYNSLSQCKDAAEKAAVIEILTTLINES